MEKLKIPLDEIKRLYIEERLTLREIAARAGVSHQDIHHHLITLGVRRRSRTVRRVKYPRYERGTMHDLYVTQGLAMTEISRRLGTSYTIIKKELAAHGIKTGRWSQLTAETRAAHAKAVQLYQQGWKVQQIAKHFNKSIETIYKVLAKAGVELRHLKLVRRELDYNTLKRLYVDERMSLRKLCKTFEVNKEKLELDLIRYKIPLRKGNRKVQYPKLARLKVGQSAMFPRTGKLNYHKRFYDDGRRIGIQVRVETIDHNSDRVWRVLYTLLEEPIFERTH